MPKKFIFIDSHPIQYNVQIYSAFSALFPEDVLVAYKAIPKGEQYEADFGKTVSWGIPLLEGYSYTNLDVKPGLAGRLKGFGDVFKLFSEHRPKVVFLHTFASPVFPAVLLFSLLFGTRVWLRSDTNDVAFKRTKLKDALRGLLYRALYIRFDRLFYVGQLNKAHYLSHGAPEKRLTFAPRCVADPIAGLDAAEKRRRRADWRRENGIGEQSLVLMFVGKFIPKKNPGIIFDALRDMAPLDREIVVVMVGSGPLEADLRRLADQLAAEKGIRTVFAGFKNQVELVDCYLGGDMLVLPSLQSGETWGLVVNEALQGGQSAVLSNFVGCGPDFSSLERVEIFNADDPQALGAGIAQLSHYAPDLDWARPAMANYSMEAVVRSLAGEWSAVGR